jgi:formate hydrogenlyase subunit 6/NADH:ubiquinone oxidoreductase subunit I
MFSWIRKGIHTGVVTTRYPAVAESLPEGFRGLPLLDAARCVADQGCRACIQTCLPGALHLADSRSDQEAQQLTLDYGRCIQCGLCVEACPTDAFHMSNVYELATTTPDDLQVIVRFMRGKNAASEQKEQEDAERI